MSKAIRPAARVSTQWNTVTLAFARRYCAQQSQSCFITASPSPILSCLRSYKPSQPTRTFSTTQHYAAKVHNPPPQAPVPPSTPTPHQKRTVKIGPLPNGAIDEVTIRRIFGGRISATDGNAVLRILHHRRTSGSLADYGVDNLGHQYNVQPNVARKALEWLRDRYPVDEARAAEEWAEKEANRIAYNLWLADPDNDSKYKDPARAFREQQKKKKEEQEVEAEEQAQLGGQRIGILHNGPSQFERNIQENRRKRLEEVTKVAEEKEARARNDEVRLATGEWVRTPSGKQLMKPGQTTYVDVFGREQVSRQKEEMERAQQKSNSPFESVEEMLAKTTVVQRLYPMTAFVLLICIASYGFAHYYIPPSPSYRLWPDLSPSTATIAALFLSNLAFCIAWRWTPLWPIMTRYFMHVPGYPRAFQALGNIFSHVQYEHLLGNMLWLTLVIGPACHELVGRGIFMGTYLSAGGIGSLFTLYWANLGKGAISAHTVGASAALWGVGTLFCLLTDQETIKIPFIKDFEVMFWPKALLAAFVAGEVVSAFRGRKGVSRMDHASHFGGMLTGASVAGYLHVTGWREWRTQQHGGVNGVPAMVEEGGSAVDVGGTIREEVKEVGAQVKKIVK